MRDHELDMQGTKCPLPLLRTQKKLKELGIGDRLTLLATDAMAPIDIAEYCNRTGHILEKSHEKDSIFKMLIISQSAQNCP